MRWFHNPTLLYYQIKDSPLINRFLLESEFEIKINFNSHLKSNPLCTNGLQLWIFPCHNICIILYSITKLCFRLHYSSDDVSSELIYRYFGDPHCNNFRVISNYNLPYIKFHFRILLLFLLHLFKKIVYLYSVVNFSNKSDFL
jgi:hypothetical protein